MRHVHPVILSKDFRITKSPYLQITKWSDDCSLLGYDLEKGREKPIGGVSGALIRTYVHQIPLRIGKTEFQAEVAFAEIENVPRLLGRKDIFERFRILFDERELRVYFSPRKGRN